MKRYYLSVQKNIRDLGGMKTKDGHSIKKGCLFRGGELSQVDENDIKIINSFHLTDIIDFRTSQGFMVHADHQFDNINYHNFPLQPLKSKEQLEIEMHNPFWFMEKGMTGVEYIKSLYCDLINNPISQEGYRNFFALIVDHPGVFYFHCSQGKDRAGLAAAFLELALGVDLSTVKEDYLLSNEAFLEETEQIVESVKGAPWFNETIKQTIYEIALAREEYLDCALDEIKKNYQSLDNYFRNILKTNIEKLNEMYLC